jgi:hypothetical protein
MSEERSAARARFLWAGAAVFVVMVATVTAFLIVVLLGGDNEPAIAAEPTEAAAPPVTVTTDVVLRSAPSGDTAIAARLDAGSAIVVAGRSIDGGWLFVEAFDEPTFRGWVEAGAVSPTPEFAALTIIQPDATHTPSPSRTAVTGQPTFTPDLSDIQIDTIFSRDNRVIVVVSNVGVVDVNADILISIDGGEPQAADVKPGEPLRPDDQLEVAFDEEYVQRRALISATVSTEPSIDELNTDNNSIETVISPDVPNDLGIAAVAFTGPEGALQVTISNNSTIPVTGSAAVSIRERKGERTRLATVRHTFSLAPDAEIVVDLPSVVGVPDELTIDDIEVHFSSDAVNDSDPTNDIFPQ